LDLAFCLWPILIKLPSMNTIWDHYDVLVKYLKPCLIYFLQNYFWFMQYMNCDNDDPINAQPSLGMHYESFHLFSFFYLSGHFLFYMYYVMCFLMSALSFVYSWLCLLFADCATTFAALKGRKQCLPLGLLFWNNANIIAYLTMDHHKSLKTRWNWLYS
jgi:hypothetical protein